MSSDLVLTVLTAAGGVALLILLAVVSGYRGTRRAARECDALIDEILRERRSNER